MLSPKKFSPMRFTASSEEAAIEGALQLVGAARDEISYDVLSETDKGITIRIRPRDDEADAPTVATMPILETPVMAPDLTETLADDDEDNEDEDEADAPLHIDSMREEFELQDEDADFDDAENGDDVGDDELDFDADLELEGDEYDEEESDDDAEDDDDEPEAELAPPIEIDAEMLERALSLAREMLDKMGLEAVVSSGQTQESDTIPLVIEGEDVGILIGKYGATLQSFQYLMNLTLNNAGGEGARVVVDAGNYRARRQESLEAVARSAAQRARREGHPVKLEPMPSNERRIVHNILQTEPGISTQSEGREPHRCIVIAPGQSDYKGSSDRQTRNVRGMGGYNRGRGGRSRR